jgi:hypothetical protein
MNLSKEKKNAVLLAEIMRKIERLKATTIGAILEIGAQYNQIRAAQLYYPESFRKFIAKETLVSYATVYNYMNLHLAYGNYKEARQVQEPTRLIKALPFVRSNINQFDKEKAKDWIHKAITLNAQDYKDEITEAKNRATGKKKAPVLECHHA